MPVMWKRCFGVEVAIGVAEPPAAFGDDADAAPGAIGDFEDFGQQLLRGAVALERDDAAVGVFDFVAAGFELKDGAADSIEQIKGLKAGDDERDADIFRQAADIPSSP